MCEKMKLEIGEYVRDIEGDIYKVDEIFLNHANINIKRHSKNIIDLIEVGDYVNGELVENTFSHYVNDEKSEHVRIYSERISVDTTKNHYYNNDIKSVVTKEQFKKMEVKINE